MPYNLEDFYSGVELGPYWRKNEILLLFHSCTHSSLAHFPFSWLIHLFNKYLVSLMYLNLFWVPGARRVSEVDVWALLLGWLTPVGWSEREGHQQERKRVCGESAAGVGVWWRVLWKGLRTAQLVKNPPGYPLQCSGLENSMDCIVHGVAKNQTRLSNFQLQDLKGEKV